MLRRLLPSCRKSTRQVVQSSSQSLIVMDSLHWQMRSRLLPTLRSSATRWRTTLASVRQSCATRRSSTVMTSADRWLPWDSRVCWPRVPSMCSVGSLPTISIIAQSRPTSSSCCAMLNSAMISHCASTIATGRVILSLPTTTSTVLQLCPKRSSLSISSWSSQHSVLPSRCHLISSSSLRLCQHVPRTRVLSSRHRRRFAWRQRVLVSSTCPTHCHGWMRSATFLHGSAMQCSVRHSTSYIVWPTVSVLHRIRVSTRIGIICRQVTTSASWQQRQQA